MEILASNIPNPGPESSFCCWNARRRLAQKDDLFMVTDCICYVRTILNQSFIVLVVVIDRCLLISLICVFNCLFVIVLITILNHCYYVFDQLYSSLSTLVNSAWCKHMLLIVDGYYELLFIICLCPSACSPGLNGLKRGQARLCYVMTCYLMLWYVMLCYVLCYDMLCYAMLCYALLRHTHSVI